MYALGFISLFVFFLSLAVLAWIVLFLWRLLGNARRKVSEPQCVRCGYPTARLSALRCPECGADLLREGILTPSMRVRSAGGVFLAIAAWTLTIVAITLLLASWVAFAIPVETDIRAELTGEPASGHYQGVALRGEGKGNDRAFAIHSAQFTRLLVVVTANDGVAHDLRLMRESPSIRFRLEGADPLDPLSGVSLGEVFRELLVSAGAPPDDPATRSEAAELVNVVNGTAFWGVSGAFQGGPFLNTTNSTIADPVGSRTTMLWMLLPSGVCLAGMGVWIAGIVILANQHAKKHRPVRHALGGDAATYGDPAPDASPSANEQAP